MLRGDNNTLKTVEKILKCIKLYNINCTWRAWPCFSIRSWHVFNSSSRPNIVFTAELSSWSIGIHKLGFWTKWITKFRYWIITIKVQILNHMNKTFKFLITWIKKVKILNYIKKIEIQNQIFKKNSGFESFR